MTAASPALACFDSQSQTGDRQLGAQLCGDENTGVGGSHQSCPLCPLPGVTLTTALSQMTDIRSSMPLVPSGIAVKLSFPIAFCAVLNVQWALPETCRSPLRGGGNKSIIRRFAVRQQQGHKGHGSPLGTGSPWLSSVLLCTSVSTAPQPEGFYATRPCSGRVTWGHRGKRALPHRAARLGHGQRLAHKRSHSLAPMENTPENRVAFVPSQKMSFHTFALTQREKTSQVCLGEQPFCHTGWKRPLHPRTVSSQTDLLLCTASSCTLRGKHSPPLPHGKPAAGRHHPCLWERGCSCRSGLTWG